MRLLFKRNHFGHSVRMTRDSGHRSMCGGLGWIAFFIKKGKKAVGVEKVWLDTETGFQGEDSALVLTEAGQSKAEVIMGERHVVRQSDGAQAMFGRFLIAPLIEQGDGEPVMTGGIIVIDLQLSVESALGLLPFSQF